METNNKVIERILAGSIEMGWCSDKEANDLRVALAKQADAAPVGEKPFGYMIVGADGAIEFATKAHHEAQEHINDACEQGDVEGAGQWRAVPVHLNRPSNDQLWDQTLRERDGYHDVADRLAGAIAEYFGEDIGEHSSANCPWDEALRAIEEAPALAQRVVSEAVPYGYYNAKYSTFFLAAQIAASDRNAELIASREFVPVYTTPPSAPVAWDADATRRLRSIVTLLGLTDSVPDGDLAGHEFAVLGFVRYEIERLKTTAPVALSDAEPRESQTLATLRKSLAGWQEEVEALRNQRDTLRQRLDLQALHQKNDVWYWQGDGTDYPESFGNSMAIVIRGDQLRAILAAATQPTDADKRDAERWQPIDNAPKDGRHILVWWKNEARLAWWLDNSKTRTPWAGWKVPSLQVMPFGSAPTHWMPLPSKPLDAAIAASAKEAK